MFFFIFLLSGVSSVFSFGDTLNCNGVADWNAARLNSMTRLRNATSIRFPKGYVNQFQYDKVFLTGCDSLWRTGSCRATKHGDCTLYDTHFGLGLAVLTIHELQYINSKMTGFARSIKNSVHYRFMVCTKPCKIVVKTLQLENLGTVEFDTSIRDFNAMDLRGVFYRRSGSEIQRNLDAYRRKIQQKMNIRPCLFARTFNSSVPQPFFP